MYNQIGIKTDYSILSSMIKIDNLINFLNTNNITTCGILDNNLNSSIEFYNKCQKNNIKPIIGLDIQIDNLSIYLYAKNQNGYKNLLKINTLNQQLTITIEDIKKYQEDIIIVIPYSSKDLLNKINIDYMSYSNNYEKKNALLLTNKIVYINIIRTLKQEDTKYLKYLNCINKGTQIDYEEDTLEYYHPDLDNDDINTINEFTNQIDIKLVNDSSYIPKYPVEDSYNYLVALTKKGLSKRLNNNVPINYVERLKHEISVIKQMGFVDYFLIVYDYVLYAKKNNIFVGPGRGSAAGSLVSYSLGITEIDPIKYDLLFERFLNPERITMPDIDIDFEYTKREQVIDYVREKYGPNRVAPIITYGTLTSKQVIKDVARVMDVELSLVEKLTKLINPKNTLRENANNKKIIDLVNSVPVLKTIYKTAIKLEGLRRHISTHAAGVVISSIDIDDIIPVTINSNTLLTGVTMEYLEDLGLLKMDFLALKNLTIIKNILELIEQDQGTKINLKEIDLNDQEVIKLFKKVDTEGIFQFESNGMKSFLRKLQIDNFDDIVAALALFRPGPMNNIDTFINRKHGKEPITYLDKVLEPILKSTYGIIIYQEQIMQILVKMGNYTFAEADNIRRAMSKKKLSVMEEEKNIFITKSINNGYTKEVAESIYELILKFANYGFNKAHSVSYAVIGYQMAYLKSHYPKYFYTNLLNMSIGNEVKTKDYLSEVKRNNINIIKPSINESTSEYILKDNNLYLPFIVIKGLSTNISNLIVEEQQKRPFSGYLDFVARCVKIGLNNTQLELLIRSDALREFNFNKKTMLLNLEIAIDYGNLCKEIDEEFVFKPIINEVEDNENYIEDELELFGFYISNHPMSKYNQKDIVKSSNIAEYFDKNIKMILMVNRLKTIKTKKDENMGFVTASDETGPTELVIFPNKNELLYEVTPSKIIEVYGKVMRRDFNYQVVVNNIVSVSDNNE